MRKIRKKWKKYTEGWVGIIIYLFLGFLIAYGVNKFLGVILNTKTPVVAVVTNSMVPTFYRGDMIIIYGEKNINVGDVVVFDTPKRKYPIIHRVFEVRDGGIITKGDHNPVTDESMFGVIPLEKIYGKAILKIPILGWVKKLFVDFTGLG